MGMGQIRFLFQFYLQSPALGPGLDNADRVFKRPVNRKSQPVNQELMGFDLGKILKLAQGALQLAAIF
jgi:hypothetical protein